MHCLEEREWEGKDSQVFLTPYFALGHIVFSQDTQPGVTCTTLNPEGLLGKTLQRADWRECLFGIWSQTQQGNRVSTQAHEALFPGEAGAVVKTLAGRLAGQVATAVLSPGSSKPCYLFSFATTCHLSGQMWRAGSRVSP